MVWGCGNGCVMTALWATCRLVSMHRPWPPSSIIPNVPCGAFQLVAHAQGDRWPQTAVAEVGMRGMSWLGPMVWRLTHAPVGWRPTEMVVCEASPALSADACGGRTPRLWSSPERV